MEAYCLKCRKKVEIQNPVETETQKGQPMVRGTCPVCKKGVCKLLKKQKGGVLGPNGETPPPSRGQSPEPDRVNMRPIRRPRTPPPDEEGGPPVPPRDYPPPRSSSLNPRQRGRGRPRKK